MPQVQILDAAIAPEKRSKPKRRNFVIMCFFISIAGGIFAVGLFEYFSAIFKNKGEDYQKIMNLYKMLIGRKL